MKLSKPVSVFFKQLISSLLSVVILFNTALPSFAQSVPQRYTLDELSQRLEKELERSAREHAFAAESTNTTTPALQQQRNYLNDPVIQQLMALRAAFVPLDLNGADGQDMSAVEKDERARFLQQYHAAIDEQVAAAEKQIKEMQAKQRAYIQEEMRRAEEAELSPALIENWQKVENDKISQAVSAAQARLQAWKTQAAGEADKQYQNALQIMEKESRKILSAKIRELMDLYNKYPQKARVYLLDIALAVLLNDGRGTDLFTEDEKNLLHDLYLENLRAGKDCKEGYSCHAALQAVSALGVLGAGMKDSAAIAEFIEAQWQTPNAAPVLLAGMGSLLAMGNYGTVRGLIDSARREENGVSADIISVSGIVNGVITMSGQYLGEISKWAQYPVPSTEAASALGEAPSGNAWEDVAHMLAEDGSREALAILRDYGINSCTLHLAMALEDRPEIDCRTIQPFLVGALISGKSGEYTGPARTDLQEGYEMDRFGTHRISREQAEENRRQQQTLVKNVQAYAAAQGLSVPAAVARRLYLKQMGDLDAASQLLLDKKLFAFFEQATNRQENLKDSVTILPYDINSGEYKARQRRDHRIKVWRTVGTLADIALLVWCSYDLIRLGTGIVNMGRAVYITTKMARSGASVASRTAVLWKMKTARSLVKINRHLPARIKGSMAVSVQGLLPQFAKVEPLLQIPSGLAVPTFTQAALQGAKYSAATGAFVLDGKQISSALGASQPALSQSVSAFQSSLNAAAERANASFASRRGWIRKLVGDRDFRYRYYLSEELKQMTLPFAQAGDRSLILDFAARVRADRSIGIPQAVRDLKAMPLIDSKGVVDPVALRRVVDPLMAGTTSKQRLEIQQALDLTQHNAGIAYTHRSRWSSWMSSLLRKDKSVYNDLLADNLLFLNENNNVMFSFTPAQKEKLLSSLASSIRLNKNISVPENISRYAGMNFSRAKLSYRTLSSSLFGAEGTLPLEFHLDLGVKGVSANQYQRVVFTQKNGSYFAGLSDGIGKPVDLSRFKIQVPASDMPVVIRGATEAGLARPLELKLNVYKNAKAFRHAALLNGEDAAAASQVHTSWLGNLLAGSRMQNKVYAHELPVYIRAADGAETLAPVRIMADTRLKLQGGRFVLGADDKLHLYRGKDLISDKLFYFSLPKRELTPFVQMASKGAFASPVHLAVNSGRNKILPLYISTGLSLSSASVGLIAPLETTYKDRITDTHKTLISLAFPYLPSLLAPALAPIVMRFGALRVVQTALATVAAGLAFTWSMGFNGKLNHEQLPPIWPLFISGAAIGVSSALSRSGLNILIDTMGGGKSLLQSMMFKNLGSLVLLAPSWIYTWSKLTAAPKLTGQKLSAEERAKPATDFSFAFPVLTVLTTSVLAYLSRARISPYIGRSSAVMNGQKMKFWSEMGRSLKTMVAPEVWPLASAAFFFTGFEAAAFSKASSQALRPFYQNREFVKNSVEGNRSNLVSMLTGLSVAALPFTARFFAPKLLKAFSNPLKPAGEYQTMLKLSYLMNATGGLMLMKYGLDPDPKMSDMLLGIGLMGLGTANVTQSLQKLANIKVGSGPTIARLVQGLPAAQAAQRATELKNITMTGFSWSQLGLAAVPLIQSSYVDKEVAQGVSDGKGPLSSIWIPLSSLAVSTGLIWYGVKGKMPIPAGLLGLSKLAVDGPLSFNPWPYFNSMADQYRHNRYEALDFKMRQYQKQVKEEDTVSDGKTAAVSAPAEELPVATDPSGASLPLSALASPEPVSAR